MSNQIRGSEKLAASCTDMHTLTEEELAQVAGGASLLSISRVFPRGIPWPELVYGGPELFVAQKLDLGVVNGIGENLKEPGALYQGY